MRLRISSHPFTNRHFNAGEHGRRRRPTRTQCAIAPASSIALACVAIVHSGGSYRCSSGRAALDITTTTTTTTANTTSTNDAFACGAALH